MLSSTIQESIMLMEIFCLLKEMITLALGQQPEKGQVKKEDKSG